MNFVTATGPIARLFWPLLVCFAITTSACSNEPDRLEVFDELAPYQNPFGTDHPLWSPQPARHKPAALALAKERGELYVTLPGPVDRPGHQIAVIDVATAQVIAHHDVGVGPSALAVDPAERYLVVANRFANHLSVINLDDHRTSRIAVDFYAEDLLFDATGERLFVANRWKNTVQVFAVQSTAESLRLTAMTQYGPEGAIDVGFNPRRLRLSTDQSTLYVASPAGLAVAVIDLTLDGRAHQPLTTASPVDANAGQTAAPAYSQWALAAHVDPIWVGAPAFDALPIGNRLFVATLSESTHHPPGLSTDDHPYGQPSIGSPNQGFQALQNEIATYSRYDLSPLTRYTSADYCCPDVDDIADDDPNRGHLLPPKTDRIVDGALPIALAPITGPPAAALLVAYAGSGQVQRFPIVDGQLQPGPTVDVGFDPRDLIVDNRRRQAYVVNRLGESVSIIDLPTFSVTHEVALGDAPTFPATDAELGEWIFYAGAPLSIDGGQTCNHCHFDRANIGKFFSMPHLADRRGHRMTLDTRGLFDDRPWFMEGAMDETTTIAEFDAFVAADNFCCHDHDAPAKCALERPSPCDEPPFADRPPRRDTFLGDRFSEKLARRRSFGDALDVPLTFEGANRLLNLFLIRYPAHLPNPNDPDSAAARRGKRLFESPRTGCLTCHAPPTFGVSTTSNPFSLPLRFGPLIEPLRSPEGKNLDRLSQDFLDRYPQALQTTQDVYLKSPSLIGLWDRAPGFYHDGRAPTLRQALATPGHRALSADDTGYNVTDEIYDTHGATSHLSADELDDLIHYLLTL